MELKVGDHIMDETGEWEVIGHPFTTAGGKNAHARTEEERHEGRVDLEKWLTYYVGSRRPLRESGRSPLGVPNDSGINSAPLRARNAPGVPTPSTRAR